MGGAAQSQPECSSSLWRPGEYIWAHCKHHELANVCAKNLWDLGEGARRSLKRMEAPKQNPNFFCNFRSRIP
jgi:hypothetical protein